MILRRPAVFDHAKRFVGIAGGVGHAVDEPDIGDQGGHR